MNFAMESYDSVVVGGGAGGLSMALLLALGGRKVALVEKAPRVGGALGSFESKGYKLDAGFHFTGGLQEGGIFDSLLKVLGVRGLIEADFLDEGTANIFNFEAEGREIEFPYGMANIARRLKALFPGEGNAIGRYFDTVGKICMATPSLDARTMHLPMQAVDEDYISLQDYLDGLSENRLLKETLKAFVMCHGTAPSEISMAGNARLCQGFYESVGRISCGGGALVDALAGKLEKLGVQIITSDAVISVADVRDRLAGRILLASGKELKIGECIFTVPPRAVASCLPKEGFPPAFFQRCESYENTPGFFTVFLSTEGEPSSRIKDSVYSFYPETNIDRLSLPGRGGPGALALVHSRCDKGNVLTAFEPMYWEQVQGWEDSVTGERPESYLSWKQDKTDEIAGRIESRFPEYRGRLKLISSASPLTYRDYLNHERGSAYGVKQKIGQYNLFGQLRVRNIFAAGQSAVLPGVLGTIIASFLVARTILGDEKFARIMTPGY